MSLKTFQLKIGAIPDNSWGPSTLKAAINFFNLTAIRGAHFFAQTAHESGNFKIFTENLNYSAEGLTKTFHKYFKDMSTTDVAAYANRPEKIANMVYSNRMGNGTKESGDGYKFRGRGIIQLTGKDNYLAFSEAIKNPQIMVNPEIVANELAFESALFFFTRNNLWQRCDKGINDSAIIQLTRLINGGINGLEERKKNTYLNAAILGI